MDTVPDSTCRRYGDGRSGTPTTNLLKTTSKYLRAMLVLGSYDGRCSYDLFVGTAIAEQRRRCADQNGANVKAIRQHCVGIAAWH